LIQHVLRVRFDIAFEVRADTRDEDEIAVADDPTEQRFLGFLAPW
jgi:hypothetical protein